MKGSAPTPPYAGAAVDPIETTLGFWNYCANLAGLWWSRHGGVQPGKLARERLRDLVAFARAASPWYRRLYAHLPRDVDSPASLPVITRAGLMANFDDACTDRRIRRADVERFMADRARVGSTFLGRYHVWKSSGTSGIPGFFVQDAQAMAVYDALVAAQLEAAAFDPARFAAARGRSALVIATGDHFASITTWEHLRRVFPSAAARSYSVLMPIARLDAELNAFRPAFVASYPSVLALLAAEERAGRLSIAPALAWSGGETLTPVAQAAIERAFGCKVMNEYGASECLAIAYGCSAGWMHVNSEWVILEGVDRMGRPTPPGEPSHTVLVTNLANRVQPILRYDLGDRITLAPGPCACGNPLPAIRVEGRKGEAIALERADGSTVRLAPLALETVVEESCGESRFQIARTATDRLEVRLGAADAKARAAAWKDASRALRDYLAAQALGNVRVSLARESPRVDPRSGKLHSVVVEARCRPRTRG
jgi:phenylacetate-coenzyme A ligase PaaK-like adenylate-forming protein